MKKRILYFIKTPPPYHGASISNQYVKNSKLLKRNFEVRIIDTHYSKNLNEIGGISIRKLLLIVNNIFKLLLELTFYKPVLIYFQLSHRRAFFREIIFIFIIKIYKVDILYHLQGKGINEEANKSRLKKILYKYAFKNSYIICLSKKLVSDISSVYFRSPFVMPNCSPMIIDKTKKSISKTPQIIYLSNLIKEKGIFDLIKAGKILKERGYKFVINIVGNEGNISKNCLEGLLEKYDLDKTIIYHGPKYNQEKFEILQQNDLFVFPTFYTNEAFPLSIVEASQSGLPIISTDEGGITDIVHENFNGKIADKQNPKDLANKIEYYLQNPNAIIEHGINSRKLYLEKYTLDIFENNLFNIFKNILTNGD